ncbi:MAG: DUF2357 domain-containing protein [Bacillota bacterium]
MNKSVLKKFFDEFNDGNSFFADIKEFIDRGQNKILQNKIVENFSVDDSWINIIGSLLFSLEQVVKNPHKFITDEEIIVNVEKARKITGKTIRHLSSHTNYIRSVNEKGEIMPSKVMTKRMEEELSIYENRFVYSLILRIISFLEQRYTAIKEQIDIHETTSLAMQSKIPLSNGNRLEYDLNLKVFVKPQNNLNIKANQENLEKIELLRKRVLALRGTPFFKILSGTKPINPPIMKTNIINMQKDYNNCYKLWIFISSYTAVGYSVEIKEKNLPIDSDYYDDLAMLAGFSLKTMLDNNIIRDELYRKGDYKRRKIKKYKELRKTDYKFSLRSKAGFDDEGIVNQYYFDKLKSLIMEKEELKASEISDVKTIDMSFQKFFRGITKLTNEMYVDVLELKDFPKPKKKLNKLQEKEFELNRQKEILKKMQVLSRLKANDLMQTLKKENTQIIKMERLKFQLAEIEAKEKGRRLTQRDITKVTEKSVSIKKIRTALKQAEQDERVRLQKEIAKQKNLVEKQKRKKKDKK